MPFATAFPLLADSKWDTFVLIIYLYCLCTFVLYLNNQSQSYTLLDFSVGLYSMTSVINKFPNPRAQWLQMVMRKGLEMMYGMILNRLQPKFASKTVANEIHLYWIFICIVYVHCIVSQQCSGHVILHHQDVAISLINEKYGKKKSVQTIYMDINSLWLSSSSSWSFMSTDFGLCSQTLYCFLQLLYEWQPTLNHIIPSRFKPLFYDLTLTHSMLLLHF